ncbi:unnamed protein product [Protopolystoma xenopodis]|uniref:PIH1D1/2/3 CS-like domain-containing protein n=1 Tax=Protopolystoma xenopodis TaxID=117903 RepID=A0A448X3D6_9PLAT|nr:unnamed protein product [Protopolystoma xenopodis]
MLNHSTQSLLSASAAANINVSTGRPLAPRPNLLRVEIDLPGIETVACLDLDISETRFRLQVCFSDNDSLFCPCYSYPFLCII